jgi:hypothetical protein
MRRIISFIVALDLFAGGLLGLWFGFEAEYWHKWVFMAGALMVSVAGY